MSVCICSLIFRVSICLLFYGNDQVDEEPYTNLNKEVRTSTKQLREDVSPVSHICAVYLEIEVETLQLR